MRTFPLLALAGGALYLLEPHYAAAFIAGLLVLGAWIFAYVRAQIEHPAEPGEGPFIVPIANVLAYVLGAIALTQPLWICVSTAVAAVLLLGGRKTLHDLAQRVPFEEVVTAGKFLILVGIVLPLLAGRPAIPYTSITPFGVWLAVVAVSTISYGSYLLSNYVFPGRGTVLTAMIGGLYSSTATTVVLARRARDEGMTAEIEAGMVAASAMMYPRVLVVCAIFNMGLARLLAPAMLTLCVLGLVVAALRARGGRKTQEVVKAPNPLAIGTAFAFALLFVVISAVTTLVQTYLGGAGVLALAAVVGVTDIDPFVLGLAQGGAANVGLELAATAIVVATASNNVLKAVYAIAFSRRRESLIPAAMLGGGAVVALAFAYFLAR
ncbi:MAG TPA: DUF4010 domain-containing protein [Candidatus Acidoferrales bacterium]|nr:DUF4010 domain-containing protein [Candidatus Acidoferrales bacterium]